MNSRPNTVLASHQAFEPRPEVSVQASLAMIYENCHWIAFFQSSAETTGSGGFAQVLDRGQLMVGLADYKIYEADEKLGEVKVWMLGRKMWLYCVL